MNQFGLVILLLLSAICGPAQSTQQAQMGSPDGRPSAVIQSLYRQVVARHPTGLPNKDDMSVFAPYLSEKLLHGIDLARACAHDWVLQDQKRRLTDDQVPEKAPFGWAESGIFSGGNERTEPDAFIVERTESEKDGSSRVYVKLKLSSPPPEAWEVAVVLVRENGHFVVDDVIYLKDKGDANGVRLSKLLSDGCDGSRWVGFAETKNKR